MADTGNPWFIPFAEPSDLVRDWPALSSAVGTAVAAGLTATKNFTAGTAITATNASWPVPTLASPVVKVTVVGGGGGAGGVHTTGTAGGNGGDGGTTTFNAGGAGSITAAGGSGGRGGLQTIAGQPGTAGLSAGNGGGGGVSSESGASPDSGANGNGGAITVAYLDLTGISTVNVTIGAGGSAGANRGAAGGRGEVIVEYAAG
jgi:hypothetical protein